jgi:OmpA-OmpF porin, OOP family
LFLVVATFVLVAPEAASADPLPSVNLRSFSPSTSPGATFYLEPSNVAGSMNFNTAGWLSWAYRPLVLRRDGEIVGKVISQQVALDATAGLGLGKRAEVGLLVPVVLAQGSDDSAATSKVLDGGKIPGQAFGDLLLTGKVTLKPVADEQLGGFGLAAIARASLPTGDRSSSIGEGAVTTELRLLAEMRLVSVSFRGTAGFKLRSSQRDFAGKTWGDEIPWGAGVFVKPQMFGLDDKGRWTWGVEAHGALPAGPDAPFTSVAQSPAYLGATARYGIRDVSLIGGVEEGLTHAAGSAPLRITFAVAWAPREHDHDHDGIEDDKDECAGLAEDRDGFQDQDGCPEGDNDEDNVPDNDDKCPLEPEDEDEFQDDDGCPDPDNDQDGILDRQDACPNEKGPPSSDPKMNGCVDKDPDHDGVMADQDRCPDQPEDTDGFQDEDGCPDPDNDQDGILDASDACPLVKGEASQDPKENGCPSPDRDGDGIANEQDKCPDQGETYNGVDDDDGCPEEAKPRNKPTAVVTEKKGQKQLGLSTPVRFATADGAEPDARSQAALRAVAQLLNAHPTWRVVVAVRPGRKPGSAELAQARAGAVAAAIFKATRRPGTVSVAGWERGKLPPGAEASGVAISLVAEGP